jgi:hypothetical protein
MWQVPAASRFSGCHNGGVASLKPETTVGRRHRKKGEREADSKWELADACLPIEEALRC